MKERKKTVVASAPGRVCFAGEDIDWISGPSILCAINLRTNVKVTTQTKRVDYIEIKARGSINDFQHLNLSDVGIYNGHVLDYVNASIKVLIDIGVSIYPIKIDIVSNIPASAGLSSSAAVTTATIKALSVFFNINLNEQQIANLAYLVEKDEIKTGAGQMDQYSCSLGGLIYLNSSKTPPYDIQKFFIPKNTELIVVDSLTPRNTSDVIKTKRIRYAQREKGILSYIDKTEKLISRIYNELKNPRINIVKLGKYITSCHRALRDDMRVSTQLLNTCVDVCIRNGAYGAKITGTGMGGCIFAILPKSKSKLIKTALEHLPVKCYITTPSYDGLTVLENYEIE